DLANITIENLRVLRQTTRRITWAFDAVTLRGRRALILCTGLTRHHGANFKVQAQIQQAAAQVGVPVARFVAGDDSAELLGHPFLITEMLEGETDYFRIVDQLDRIDPRQGRARLLHQCASALATIHRIKPSTSEPTSREQLLAVLRGQLDKMKDASATFE